jgi:hypothetical protein
LLFPHLANDTDPSFHLYHQSVPHKCT